MFAELAQRKDKERILKRVKAIKPGGVKVLMNWLRFRILKREEKAPKVLAARNKSKVAYFPLDQKIS